MNFSQHFSAAPSRDGPLLLLRCFVLGSVRRCVAFIFFGQKTNTARVFINCGRPRPTCLIFFAFPRFTHPLHLSLFVAKQCRTPCSHPNNRPFLLRRIKSDVETSLPAKTELVLYAPMSEKQRELNDQLRDKTLMVRFPFFPSLFLHFWDLCVLLCRLCAIASKERANA